MSKAIDINDPFRRLHETNPDLYGFARSFTWTDVEIEQIRQLPFSRTSQEANFKLIFEFRMMIENKKTAELGRLDSQDNSKHMKTIGKLTYVLAASAIIQTVAMIIQFFKN